MVERHDDHALWQPLRLLRQAGIADKFPPCIIQRQDAVRIARIMLQLLNGYTRFRAQHGSDATGVVVSNKWLQTGIQPQVEVGPGRQHWRDEVMVVAGAGNGVKIGEVESLEREHGQVGPDHSHQFRRPA